MNTWTHCHIQVNSYYMLLFLNTILIEKHLEAACLGYCVKDEHYMLQMSANKASGEIVSINFVDSCGRTIGNASPDGCYVHA